MIDRACISLNARCNLKCVYCHFNKKIDNNKGKDFTKEEILVFCSNLCLYIKQKNIKSFKLGIVGSGEPLLSFNILKTIVEYFDLIDLKNSIKMYTISNGTLLNEKIVEFFYKHKDIIELNVSIDGDYEINNKLRGTFPKLDYYKKQFGVMPKINTVVTKDIIDNQDRILSFYLDNGFNRVNFSKVFGTQDSTITITQEEYDAFLDHAKKVGIESRQNIIEQKYDCAKYGRLCGVGRNNVFFTKEGVYPCARFMNLEKYIVGKWDDKIDVIEENLYRFTPCLSGQCYYEVNGVGI